VTLGAHKGYDVHDFVSELRHMNVTPHVAQNDTNRRSAINQRTTRHDGYCVSQRKRKRIEEVFGWMQRRRAHTSTATIWASVDASKPMPTSILPSLSRLPGASW
jgi:hypothetical protein